MPTGQSACVAAPPLQKPPCGQSSGSTVPFAGHTKRVGHGRHALWPGEGWNVPAAQGVGMEAPAGEKEPAGVSICVGVEEPPVQ